MIELSEKTLDIINFLFSKEDNEEVKELLKIECADNIPYCENNTKIEMERIRFSVLKLSEGKIAKLIEAIELAQTDWRDLFVIAGFGYDIDAHNKWKP